MSNEVSMRKAAHIFSVLNGSFQNSLSRIRNDNGSKLKLHFCRLEKNISFFDKRLRHISLMSKPRQPSIDFRKNNSWN